MAIKSDKYINIGKLALKIVWVVFMLASLNNVNRQVGVFLKASKENKKLEEEIYKLEKNNIILEQNIRYATSSDYLAAATRDEFGLGTIDDYWINVPEMDITNDGNDVENKSLSNWKMWLRLFTN